jgi:hypothetical protein
MKVDHARRRPADEGQGRSATVPLRAVQSVGWLDEEPRARRPASPPPATAVPIEAPAPRRTVTVSGRPDAPSRERRRRRSTATRNGPDRLALWAVVLGLFLAIVAATSARGDEDPRPAAAGATTVELDR